MRTLLFGLLLVVSTGGYGEYLPASLKFTGEFESSKSTAAACDDLFVVGKYDVGHYLSGYNRRTSVLHLKSAEKGAFFNALSLVGLYGYQDDFQDEAEFTRGGYDYALVADGIVTPRFILFDLTVTKRVAGAKTVLCQAQGRYSAFP